MAETNGSVRSRSLFTGAEALRVNVDGKARGPIDTWYPVDLPAAVASLVPEAETIAAYFASLPSSLRDQRVYFEAQVRPNFLAATHAPVTLMRSIGATQVGTEVTEGVYQGPTKEPSLEVTKRLILSVPYETVALLPSVIQAANALDDERFATDIQKIERLMLPAPLPKTIDGEKGSLVSYEAVLHPSVHKSGARQPTDRVVLEKWFDWANDLGAEVDREYFRTVGDLTFTLVRVPRGVEEQLVRFNPLRSLRPMPDFRPVLDFGLRSLGRVSAPVSTQPRSTAFSVGVFDGGVDSAGTNAAIFPDPDVVLTSIPSTARSSKHGTSVVGACMYGLVDDGDQLLRPPLKVVSYRIMPPHAVKDDRYCYWALDRIKEVVSKREHDVYNISLGPNLPVDDATVPNRWTSELDQLAWQYQVLIVVAAGNDGDLPPNHRVQVPGDMVNGLTVGACNSPAPAAKWSRSDFSSFGPGRHGARVQPSVVQYGGTRTSPMPVLAGDGTIREDGGTSFAAPLVTHAISDLAVRLDDASPSTMRAFAIHYAERPSPQRQISQVGHGRAPLRFGPSMEASDDKIHVLYRDQAIRKVDVSYEIPTADTPDMNLDVRVTLAFASPIDPADCLEYTLASLDLTLRPHRDDYDFNPPAIGGAPSRAMLRSAEARALSNLGWKPSRHPRSKSVPAIRSAAHREGWLRSQGKWETSRQFRFSLKANQYLEPRLHMTYLARSNGQLVDVAPPVDFSLLITATDKDGGGRLYQEVQLKYPVLVELPPLSGGQIRV